MHIHDDPPRFEILRAKGADFTSSFEEEGAALLLAIGSQGAKIYRAITGTGQVHIDGEVSHEQDLDLEDQAH